MNNSITYLNNNPDVANYILPVYALGIGVYLHLTRIIYLKHAKDGSPVTPTIVGEFRKAVQNCKDGLVNALTQYKARYTDEISKIGITGTSEEKQIALIFNHINIQEDTTTNLDRMLDDLN